MTTLALRAPTRRDAGALADLHARVLSGPAATPDEVERDLADIPSRDGWLVEDGGTIAGFATASLRDATLVDAVLVAEDVAAAALLERIERRAAELRARSIRVSARPASLDLSERGFRPARAFSRLLAARESVAAASPAPGEIAPVAPTDEALHTLEQRCFAGSWGFLPERLASWRSRVERLPAAPAFVARVDGAAAGGIRCTTRFGAGWISALVVLPEARGLGLGAQLLAAAARALTGERIGLDVDEENVPACRLYTRLGFAEVDRERFWEKKL